jgi:hypothetical protein
MVKIYTLVDARRAIRKLHLDSERITRSLAKPTENSKNVSKTIPGLQALSKFLQAAQTNHENARSVRIALETQLCEGTNLVGRLKRNAQLIEDRSKEQMNAIEDKLSHLSTKFEGKLQILIKDLDRRLQRHYQTRHMVRQVQDRELGVIRIYKPENDKTAFCVIMTEPLDLKEDAIQSLGHNSYKIFFNEIPPDLSLDNFNPFLSPSKAVGDILKTLDDDGF